MATDSSGTDQRWADKSHEAGLRPAGQSSLLEVAYDRQGELPLSEQAGFLQDALGPLVAGGRYLLSGPPGSLKSRLSTQVMLDLGRQGIKSAAILTEEPASKLKQRAIQMVGDWQRQDAAKALEHIQPVTGIYDVATLPAFLTRDVLSPAGQHHGVKLIVLDSIQGQGLAGAATKAYAKVAEFAQLCAENGITTLLLCHTTKRNDVAGPRSLEHSVDASVVLRQAMSYVLLWVKKNRFAAPLRKPMHLHPHPVTTWLSESPYVQAQPTMARAFVGRLIEIQSSVTVPMEGRGRITAPGLPRKEIDQLIACIGQIQAMDIEDLSYTINCRLPAIGQYHPVFGLALAMSLISSFVRRPIPPEGIYVGEIDLFRHVCQVPPLVMERLTASLQADEIPTPTTLYLPAVSAADLPELPTGVTVVPCRTLEDAIFHTWPDLR